MLLPYMTKALRRAIMLRSSMKRENSVVFLGCAKYARKLVPLRAHPVHENKYPAKISTIKVMIPCCLVAVTKINSKLIVIYSNLSAHLYPYALI